MRFFIGFLFACVLASCSVPATPTNLPTANTTAFSDVNATTRLKAMTKAVSDDGKQRKLKFSNNEDIQFEIIGNNVVYDGDILAGTAAEIEVKITKYETYLKKKGPIKSTGLLVNSQCYFWLFWCWNSFPPGNGVWPNKTVYYTFDSSITYAEQGEIYSAMGLWIGRTGVNFTSHSGSTSSIPGRITFRHGSTQSACFSALGFQGSGGQYIDLPTTGGCGIGSMAHEIGHALGLIHEHQRCDRDSYITINTGNIQSQYLYAFDKKCQDQQYGSYDFDSIMHYGSYSFSSNGSPSIGVPSGANIGQRDHLSNGDVNAIRSRYP